MPEGRPAYTPTISELRALVGVAELGSTAAAADALSLTQSAVSRSVGALEERLAVRLFRRERQRMILSDAGRAMLRDARDILDRLDASARMIMAFGGGSEVLRLAVLPTFATAWLIPRLPAFTRLHPDVSLDLGQALLPVDFEASPFDAAIQRVEMARPGTTVLPLCPERLIVVAAPGLIGERDIPPEALLHLPLIQQATRPQIWTDWLRVAGLEPFRAMQGPRLEHFDMVLAAAEAGLGAALLPDIFAAQAVSSGALVHLFPGLVLDRSTYALITPARMEPAGAVERFSRWLSREAVSGADA